MHISLLLAAVKNAEAQRTLLEHQHKAILCTLVDPQRLAQGGQLVQGVKGRWGGLNVIGGGKKGVDRMGW